MQSIEGDGGSKTHDSGEEGSGLDGIVAASDSNEVTTAIVHWTERHLDSKEPSVVELYKYVL